MAFIEGQDEDELQQGQQAGGQAPLVGQGSSLVGQGPGGSAAAGGPAGAGGAGGWVNLQTYLNANANNGGSAQALSNTVNDQFKKERDAMTSQSGQFLSDAEKFSKDNSLTMGQVDDYTKRATELYNWGYGGQPAGTPKPKDPFAGGSDPDPLGKQQKVTPGDEEPDIGGDSGNVDSSKDYADLVGQIQTGLNAQYTGPRDYSYGLSNESQEYGSALKDPGGFDQLMNQVYTNSAGRPMTQGQLALQRQLDVNNVGLDQARGNLSGAYDQLGKDRDKIVADTTSGLGQIESNFRKNQNDIRDYLGGKSNTYNEQISQAEADARAAYDKTFREGQSNYQTMDQYLSNNLGETDIYTGLAKNYLPSYYHGADNGVAGYNWQDMQHILDGSSPLNQDDYGSAMFASSPSISGTWGAWDTVKGLEGDYKQLLQQQLADFYAGQEAQYQDTALDQKMAYNVLQDFLGLNEKKQRDFNVRA